jgi:hypothetical protein
LVDDGYGETHGFGVGARDDELVSVEELIVPVLNALTEDEGLGLVSCRQGFDVLGVDVKVVVHGLDEVRLGGQHSEVWGEQGVELLGFNFEVESTGLEFGSGVSRFGGEGTEEDRDWVGIPLQALHTELGQELKTVPGAADRGELTLFDDFFRVELDLLPEDLKLKALGFATEEVIFFEVGVSGLENGPKRREDRGNSEGVCGVLVLGLLVQFRVGSLGVLDEVGDKIKDIFSTGWKVGLGFLEGRADGMILRLVLVEAVLSFARGLILEIALSFIVRDKEVVAGGVGDALSCDVLLEGDALKRSESGEDGRQRETTVEKFREVLSDDFGEFFLRGLGVWVWVLGEVEDILGDELKQRKIGLVSERVRQVEGDLDEQLLVSSFRGFAEKGSEVGSR